MADNTSQVPQPQPPAPWPRTVLWIAVVFGFAGAATLVFRSCVDAPGRVIGQAGNALATVAAAFNRGTITTSFVSYATTLSNNLHLQVATLRQTEVFSRREEKSTGFGYIPLPDVVVEARAPVEYVYYLDLKESWRFVLKDQVVQVFAPPLHFNQPAVDASAITYEVTKGYFKTAEAQEHLKRAITPLVAARARDNLGLVREAARRQTAEFVENWLLRVFRDGREYAVKVYFPDEPLPGPVLLPGVPLP
jgi:hypothetical protein